MAIVKGFKGTLDFYYNMGIPCVRKWPQSPGKIRSEAVMAQWPVFANAAKLYRDLSPAMKTVYLEMAAETNLTARDVFTKSYISGMLSWYTPPADYEQANP